MRYKNHSDCAILFVTDNLAEPQVFRDWRTNIVFQPFDNSARSGTIDPLLAASNVKVTLWQNEGIGPAKQWPRRIRERMPSDVLANANGSAACSEFFV